MERIQTLEKLVRQGDREALEELYEEVRNISISGDTSEIKGVLEVLSKLHSDGLTSSDFEEKILDKITLIYDGPSLDWIEAIIDFIKDFKSEGAFEYLQELLYIGASSVEGYRESDDPEMLDYSVKKSVIDAFVNSTNKSIITKLTDPIIAGEPYRPIEEVIEILARIGGEEVVEPLMLVLLSNRCGEYDNERIVEVLGEIGDKRSIHALIYAIENPIGEDAFRKAVKILGDFRDKKALKPLKAKLKDDWLEDWPEDLELIEEAIKKIENS